MAMGIIIHRPSLPGGVGEGVCMKPRLQLKVEALMLIYLKFLLGQKIIEAVSGYWRQPQELKVFCFCYEITGRIIHITLLLPLLTRYDVKAPVFDPLKSMFPSPSI